MDDEGSEKRARPSERVDLPPRAELWMRHVPFVLMGIAATLLSALIVTVLFFLFFVQVDPIESETLVQVEPADRVLDRTETPRFRWTREVCSRRDVQAQVLRAWTEDLPSVPVRPVVMFSNVPYQLAKGCHPYLVEQNIPESLPPGRYVYESTMRHCDLLGRCSSHALTPIPVVVRGGKHWPNSNPGMPSPLVVIPRNMR